MEFAREYTVYGPRTHLSKPMSVRMISWLFMQWRPFSESYNLCILNYDNAGQLHADSFNYLDTMRIAEKVCDKKNELKSAVSSLSSRIVRVTRTETCQGVITRYRMEVESVKL